MRTSWLGLALGVAVGAIVACGGAAMKPAAPAPQAAATSVMAPSPHDEIDRLSREIADEMARMGLEAPAPAVLPAAPDHGPAAAAAIVKPSDDPTCKPAARDVCQDSCKLGDSICVNAGRICELAGELPGDRYAADKCDTATTSCTAARERCCGCT